MPKLTCSLEFLSETDFDQSLKAEIEALPIDQLPLQKGLSQSSYVSDSPIKAVILARETLEAFIKVKAGIFYSGIIGGCNCADDPSPVDEINEYCEIQILINRQTAEAEINLL